MVRSSVSLGRLWGIPVGLHWSAALAGSFLTWTLATLVIPTLTGGTGTLTTWGVALLGAAAIGASIVAHEFGHALAARRNGVQTASITLWALGGLAALRSEARTARGAAEVAVAGPAVSVVAGLAAGVLAGLSWVAVGTNALTAMIAWLAVTNLGLAVFNLIPLLPLDGGRLLQAGLWHRSGDRHGATISAARLGSFGGGLMMLGGFLAMMGVGPATITMLPLGWFIRAGARGEARRARRLRRIERHAERARDQQARPQGARPVHPFVWLVGRPAQARAGATTNRVHAPSDIESQLPLWNGRPSGSDDPPKM